jgi:hypothetical protein
MNEIGILGFIALIIGLTLLFGMRSKLLPINQVSVVSNILLLIILDVLAMIVVGISGFLLIGLFFTLTGNFLGKIEQKRYRYKTYFTGILGCIGFLIISGEGNLIGTMNFNLVMLNILAIIILIIIIGLGVMPLIFDALAGTYKPALIHLGIKLLSFIFVLGLGYLIGGLISILSNTSSTLLVILIILGIQVSFPCLALYYFFKFPKIKAVPIQLQKEPTLNPHFNDQANESNENFQPASTKDDSDELTEVHSEAKYRFQGFIAPDQKHSAPPEKETFELPTICPNCKGTLNPDGICPNCRKRICPRCYNLNPIKSFSCTCGYIFEQKKY